MNVQVRVRPSHGFCSLCRPARPPEPATAAKADQGSVDLSFPVWPSGGLQRLPAAHGFKIAASSEAPESLAAFEPTQLPPIHGVPSCDIALSAPGLQDSRQQGYSRLSLLASKADFKKRALVFTDRLIEVRAAANFALVQHTNSIKWRKQKSGELRPSVIGNYVVELRRDDEICEKGRAARREDGCAAGQAGGGCSRRRSCLPMLCLWAPSAEGH